LYQPIYGMDAGQLLKAEALLRWKHPRLGVLRPMEFLPMADDHRLLGRIGDWVLERVARDAHRWRASGDVAVQVIVNVSVAQLEAEPDCASKWLARLAELDARPEWFVIELSERALANLG